MYKIQQEKEQFEVKTEKDDSADSTDIKRVDFRSLWLLVCRQKGNSIFFIFSINQLSRNLRKESISRDFRSFEDRSLQNYLLVLYLSKIELPMLVL